MRRGWQRAVASAAVAGMILAGCGEGDDATGESQDGPAEDAGSADADAEEGRSDEEQALDELLGEQDLEDPNEDVQDGEYRGRGVVLPVPDGWSLDRMAFTQGRVIAIPEDGAQQLSAFAIDAEQAEATGQPMDLDSLLQGVRDQVGEDAEVDEEVELAGAERAHRLTYLGLSAGQEAAAPASSVTVVLAVDGDGTVGEFVYGATAEDYDDAHASLLVEQAGFDPDSEPAAIPQPQQPAPQEDQGADDGADDSADEGADG